VPDTGAAAPENVISRKSASVKDAAAQVIVIGLLYVDGAAKILRDALPPPEIVNVPFIT
jgi:hypothetical protein